MASKITLIAPGSREIVTEGRAHEIISEWEKQLNDKDTVNVEKIVLSDKSYKSEAAQVIADYLVSRGIASNIKIAILSDIIASRPEDEGIQVLKTICDAFQNSCLEEVDLSDNALGSKGISSCSSVLSGQKKSLQKLSLCNNGLSAEAMQEVAEILNETEEDSDDCECISKNLKKIHFYNNMSGNGGCEAFAKIVSKCSDKIEDIRFSSTRAGGEGSMMIATALEAMEDNLLNVTRLDLADNSFGTDGGIVLSRALRLCPNLRYLNLCDCLLEDAATGNICRALWSVDAPLDHLDLSGNEISKKGAKFIADMLEESIGGTLRVFHCEENEMTSTGIADIAPSFGKSIEEIKLGTNECGSIGAQALIQAYGDGASMPNLKKIELDGNMFPEEDAEALSKAFGPLLVEMEDNDEDEDVDQNLDEDDEDEDDDDFDDEDDSEDDGKINSVAALSKMLEGVNMKHSLI